MTKSHESCGKHFKTCRVLHKPTFDPVEPVDIPVANLDASLAAAAPLPAPLLGPPLVAQVPAAAAAAPGKKVPEEAAPKKDTDWIEPKNKNGKKCLRCKPNTYCPAHRDFL
jgi:hypothetical protein